MTISFTLVPKSISKNIVRVIYNYGHFNTSQDCKYYYYYWNVIVFVYLCSFKEKEDFEYHYNVTVFIYDCSF